MFSFERRLSKLSDGAMNSNKRRFTLVCKQRNCLRKKPSPQSGTRQSTTADSDKFCLAYFMPLAETDVKLMLPDQLFVNHSKCTFDSYAH